MARLAAKTLSADARTGGPLRLVLRSLGGGRTPGDSQCAAHLDRRAEGADGQKAVLVIDVRDPDSFTKGRIPGAVNVDYTQVLQQADRFKGETRTIVTYCACASEMTVGARGG